MPKTKCTDRSHFYYKVLTMMVDTEPATTQVPGICSYSSARKVLLASLPRSPWHDALTCR